MDQIRSDKPEGAPACAHNADAGAPSGGAGPERRFSTRRKLAAVTRLLRAEPLEILAGSVEKFAASCEWPQRQASQAAMSNSSATKVAWACMSRPPILRTCPFLTIAITS